MRHLACITQVAALAMFAASLALPLFETAEWGATSGAWALFLGWGYLLEGKFAWLANPLFFLSLFPYRKRPDVAVALSAIALEVGLLEYPYSYVQSIGFDSSREIAQGRITGIGVAASVWLLSLALSLLHGMLVAKQHARRAADAL